MDGQIDPGIAHAVEILQQNGVETFESCEGGEGHAFPVPTVRFHGSPAAGPRALAVCMDFGLPVLALRRVWYFQDGEPTDPTWDLVFRHKFASVGRNPEGEDREDGLRAEHEHAVGDSRDAQPLPQSTRE